MTSSLRFSDIAELRNEKVDPATCSGSRYIGLEHIEQDSLSLSGWGTAEDVDSQKQRFYKGDVLFGKLRPYFRKVVIAPFDGICSTDIWVVKPVIASDRDFVFYWMASDDFITRATNASEGTRMPRAKWDWVSGFELPEMSLEKRKIVGRILRVMDLTISLNRSISRTLEEIARSIFRSWFVDFDPVKAKMAGEKPVGMDEATAALLPDSMEDSELDPIPKGWVVATIGEVVVKQRPGKLYDKKTSSRVGSIPVLDQGRSGVVGYHDDVPGYVATPESPVVVFANHTCSLRFVSYPFSVIQNVFPILGNDLSVYWLYFALQGKQEFDSYKGHWPDLVIKPVVRPPQIVSKAFENLTSPLMKLVWNLEKENQGLVHLRDSLLPRLISGELRIPDGMLVS